MPTHPCKHSDDAQIVSDILKEAAEPRQAASVKKALEKGTLPLPPRKPRPPMKSLRARRWMIQEALILLTPIILAFIGILWFHTGPSTHSELENLLVLFRY